MAFWILDVYPPPSDSVRETHIAELIARHGGHLIARDDEADGSEIWLTYQFAEQSEADAAAIEAQANGWHVDAPYLYF